MILIPFGPTVDKYQEPERCCCAFRPKRARTPLRRAPWGPIHLWKYPASACVVNSF